ncbi:transcriptional regulator, Spx/MgsR family [Mariprofundus ferrinatatus]|uniref:Transcriptional regulator, Spx/MgsR family n=1 Tax=Mariprofundus ferrinatatus TaxID=1921087 RepID=A0A2K8L4Z4_9PROT|nr:ArsC family reductase [Mariprofundus ferrinatatus]ATX82390.1 transcriptional regulator, Spx/MgsR family [Mariprofundus ferrinatatus]
MINLYGIPNCDSMKKARKWLHEHAVDYTFHDYKKEGVDAARLSGWVERVGWEPLLNRRGLTWRKLPDAAKADLDEVRAVALMQEFPSMIKRPVLVVGKRIEVGFSEQRYSEIFQ